MLIWVFGEVKESKLIKLCNSKASGYLLLQQANVNWKLSVDDVDIPEKLKLEGKRTYRSLKLEGEEVEFSDGFTDLHIRSYGEILEGNGFGLKESMKSIELVQKFRD
jgi:UDP-N-acetyl-2-amino-2-deoxyglucuronate dehydrogenase